MVAALRDPEETRARMDSARGGDRSAQVQKEASMPRQLPLSRSETIPDRTGEHRRPEGAEHVEISRRDKGESRLECETQVRPESVDSGSGVGCMEPPAKS